MAKLRVDPDMAARAAFQQEIRVKRAYFNVKQSQMADALDIGAPRMSALLAKPDDISIGRLRAIIKMLRLDPVVVLAFLGYSQKDVKKLWESQGARESRYG